MIAPTEKLPTILETILATKREEIIALRSRNGITELREACRDLPPTRDFRAALLQGCTPETPALIAEVKKASPSKGVIRADFDPVAIGQAYVAGGASCLSVLTDRDYFQGDLVYLTALHSAVPLPLLRKDFIVDTAQVYEARQARADAILLIVAAVPSPARLAELRDLAESLGLAVLVEVHQERELEIAVESGATLIGVNNRDLHTFAVDLAVSEQLIPRFPAGTLAVAESGIHTTAEVRRMGVAGATAVLVGESLIRQSDITRATRELLGNR